MALSRRRSLASSRSSRPRVRGSCWRLLESRAAQTSEPHYLGDPTSARVASRDDSFAIRTPMANYAPPSASAFE